MKKLNTTILVALVALLSTSCSSIKLTNSWVSNDIDETKNKKVLVVARSTDMDIRKSYETELVANLNEHGINAVAANKLFPDLVEKKNRSQKEIDIIIRKFTDAGIQSILLTALKDTKVQESLLELDKNKSISTASLGRYGLSFSDYYNVHSIDYLSQTLRPTDKAAEIVGPKLRSTTYVLEAVVYD